MSKVRWIMGMVGIGLCLTASRGFAQGSLTPPGAPAPTMKTLAQIEPRTPITNAPYTITQPGSYYLTANLTSTTYGIFIQANQVTLDLMGFSLTGDRGANDYGIWVFGVTNVVVRGGIVSDFYSGLRCTRVQNSRFEGLVVSRNVNNGVQLFGNSGQCDGNIVADCTLSDNGSSGIYLSGSSGQCNGNTIVGCAISGNASCGVYFDGDTGQCAGNRMAHCVLRNNTTYGIYLSYADGNRIENNHVSGTTGASSYGIMTSSSSANLILQNTCVGQTNNYNINANDTYGPIVTTSGALATTNGAAALSPWANFSR